MVADREKTGPETHGAEELQAFKAGQNKASAWLKPSNFSLSHVHSSMLYSTSCFPAVTLESHLKLQLLPENKELGSYHLFPQTHLLLQFYFSTAVPYRALGTSTPGSHVWPVGKQGRIKVSQVLPTGSYNTLP